MDVGFTVRGCVGRSNGRLEALFEVSGTRQDSGIGNGNLRGGKPRGGEGGKSGIRPFVFSLS